MGNSFQLLILIAQMMRLATLNATQKTKALYKATFKKKIKKNFQKLAKNAFLLKNANFLAVYLDFFKNCVLQRAVVFCVALSVASRLI